MNTPYEFIREALTESPLISDEDAIRFAQWFTEHADGPENWNLPAVLNHIERKFHAGYDSAFITFEIFPSRSKSGFMESITIDTDCARGYLRPQRQ